MPRLARDSNDCSIPHLIPRSIASSRQRSTEHRRRGSAVAVSASTSEVTGTQ